MLGDIDDFIGFSEANISWHKHREIQRTKDECNNIKFDNSHEEGQYRYQMLEGVEYRFEVSLKQRVRYAGLVALVTTIEWAILTLKKRSKFDFPQKPPNKNPAIHALTVFNERACLGLDEIIQFIETIIHTRNCVVHSAGLLASYKFPQELRQALASLHGVQISDVNFLGESIEIDSGFLQNVIADIRNWFPNVEKILAEKGLLR